MKIYKRKNGESAVALRIVGSIPSRKKTILVTGKQLFLIWQIVYVSLKAYKRDTGIIPSARYKQKDTQSKKTPVYSAHRRKVRVTLSDIQDESFLCTLESCRIYNNE